MRRVYIFLIASFILMVLPSSAIAAEVIHKYNAVSLLSPTNNSKVGSRTTFKWSFNKDPFMRYAYPLIEIATNPWAGSDGMFTGSVVYQNGFKQAKMSMTGPNLKPGTYYWHVIVFTGKMMLVDPDTMDYEVWQERLHSRTGRFIIPKKKPKKKR